MAGEAGLGLKKVARAPLAGSCQWAVSWLTGFVFEWWPGTSRGT